MQSVLLACRCRVPQRQFTCIVTSTQSLLTATGCIATSRWEVTHLWTTPPASPWPPAAAVSPPAAAAAAAAAAVPPDSLTNQHSGQGGACIACGPGTLSAALWDGCWDSCCSDSRASERPCATRLQGSSQLCYMLGSCEKCTIIHCCA